MSVTLRIKFSRLGPVRYLGHLDMLRYFQKAIMRSGIDVRYSEGFNPHQILSFAYPLGVSMETTGDYLDMDVNSMNSCEEITQQLNAVMNEGIFVVQTTIVPEGEKNAMSSVYAADYCLEITETITEEELKNFFALPEIVILKEGKKGTKEQNIKEGILALEFVANNKIFMKLKSGSEMNVKPTNVIEALASYLNKPISVQKNTRLEIYRCLEDGSLAELGTFA